MTLTPEQQERHRRATSSEVRGEASRERMALWRETTPQVLQDAMWATTHGGTTPQQSRILTNWVTASVFDAPESFIQHFAQLLREARRDH